MTQQPQAKYRHDYRAPDYQITDIDLTFDLDAQKTVVTAVSQAVRHGASDAPLRLDGEDLKLVSVHINDEPWTAWKEEEGALVISNLPERFTLKIVNEISPATNTALEGLYQSGEALWESLGGFRILSWDAPKRTLRAAFSVRREFCHTNGTIAQGGFITAWLDAAMAHAVIHDSAHTQTVFSLEIKVSFYEKVGPGEGRVEGRVIRRGKRVAFLEGALYNADGKLAAEATSTGILAPL